MFNIYSYEKKLNDKYTETKNKELELKLFEQRKSKENNL